MPETKKEAKERIEEEKAKADAKVEAKQVAKALELDRLAAEKAEAKAVKADAKEAARFPNVGDTVHIVQMNGFHSAALVTGVDSESGAIKLFVTRDDDVKDHYYTENLPYSKEAVPGSWHWPEKE